MSGRFPHHRLDGSLDLPQLRNALMVYSYLGEDRRKKIYRHLKRHADETGLETPKWKWVLVGKKRKRTKEENNEKSLPSLWTEAWGR